jgi:hypothetical protein
MRNSPYLSEITRSFLSFNPVNYTRLGTPVFVKIS